jgi:hypothetical protein
MFPAWVNVIECCFKIARKNALFDIQFSLIAKSLVENYAIKVNLQISHTLRVRGSFLAFCFNSPTSQMIGGRIRMLIAARSICSLKQVAILSEVASACE